MTIVPTATQQPAPNLPQKDRMAKPCACPTTNIVATQADAMDSAIPHTKGPAFLTPNSRPDPISP